MTRSLKKIPKRFLIYASLAAVFTFLLIFSQRSEKTDTPEIKIPEITAAETKSYSEKLEDELEEIISKIRGVSEVTVMVTVDGSDRKIYASDVSESEAKTESSPVIIGSKEALLEGSEYPKVNGVLVVCRGGDSPSVKEKVVNAVSTVLDIPTGKVFVTQAK